MSKKKWPKNLSEPFVVKAQCSLFSSVGPTILIYDSSHSVMHEGPATPEMVKAIGDRSFWWAAVDRKTKQFVMDTQSKENRATEDEYEKYDYNTMNGVKNA